MKKILLFLFMTIFSYSHDNSIPSCPLNYYRSDTPIILSSSISVYYGNYDCYIPSVYPPEPWNSYYSDVSLHPQYGSRIVTYNYVEFYKLTVEDYTDIPSCSVAGVSGAPKKITVNQLRYTCSPNPLCDENQTLDTSVNPPVCVDNNTPTCEELPNSHYDVQQEECVCNNGYPKLYNFALSRWECQVPKCADFDGDLPLYKENVTQDYCMSLTNPILGFTSTWHSNGEISCCYADTYKSPDDECPPNYIADENGVCREIRHTPDNNDTNSTPPSIDPDTGLPPPPENPPVDDSPENGGGSGNTGGTDSDCIDGYVWSNELQKCVKFLPIIDSNGSGTIDLPTDTNNTDTTDTNNTVSPDTIKFENDVDFDESFFDNLFKSDKDKFTKTALSGLESAQGIFLSIHTITIPTVSSSSCSCNDYTIDISSPLGNFTKKIEFCQYLTQVLSGVKYVLWFLVVYILIIRIKEVV